MASKSHKNDYKLMLSIVGLIAILFVFYVGLRAYMPSSQPQDQVADTISEVKLEFIPQTVYAQCNVYDISCSVSFQVKNVGNKVAYFSPGDLDYTKNQVNGAGIGIATDGNQVAYLKPNEISKTLRVEIYTSVTGSGITTPVGTRTIKIPFQIYNSGSQRIGASDYYLPVQLTVIENG